MWGGFKKLKAWIRAAAKFLDALGGRVDGIDGRVAGVLDQLSSFLTELRALRDALTGPLSGITSELSKLRTQVGQVQAKQDAASGSVAGVTMGLSASELERKSAAFKAELAAMLAPIHAQLVSDRDERFARLAVWENYMREYVEAARAQGIMLPDVPPPAD